MKSDALPLLHTTSTPCGSAKAALPIFLGAESAKRGWQALKPHAPASTKPFGRFLVEKGILTPEELAPVLQLSKFRKQKLGRMLAELGVVTQERLDSLLIEFLQPECTLSYEELREAVSLVTGISAPDREFLHGMQLVPIVWNHAQIVVVTTLFSYAVVSALEERLERDIDVLTVDAQILQLLLQQDGCVAPKEKGPRIVVAENLSDDQRLSQADPFTQVIKSCFEAAKKAGASDIHFEPYDQEYVIRLRVHGQLTDWKHLSSEHAEPLTARLKGIVNMDLGIVGQPQDSRATLRSLGLDIRASSMPVTSGGEKIVLRLQYQEKSLNIRKLGIGEEKLAALLDSITKSDGLILISGPTGSGKTTTLYALLEEMDRLGKNISTLENPVEKQLKRINQANILDHKDFASFQRALMRQDPDVILLGEIRDAETADLSLKLASTGHLVLSTIHANGAAQVVDRLTNLGADLFSIRTNLRMSVAQRLLRTLCSACSLAAPEEWVSRVGGAGDFRVTNPDGCNACHHGVTGRIAVIEYLGKGDVDKLGVQEVVVASPLSEECIELARKGVIDVKDALFFQ